MEILLIVDTAPEKGLGHLSRCLVLARALYEQGAMCRFLVTHKCSAEMLDRFPAAVLNDAPLSADIVVIDGYDFDVELIDKLRTSANRVVLIDDLGERPYSADIVVNPNFYAEEVDYAAYGARRLLVGPRYCLVRREFFALRSQPTPHNGHILISLGGGQAAFHGIDLAHALRAHCDVSISVALGRAQMSEDLCSLAEVSFHVGQDLLALMKRASLVVCGLGVTFMEAVAAGREVIGVQVAKNQRLAFAAARKRGFPVFSLQDTSAIAITAAAKSHYRRATPVDLLESSGPISVARAILSND